MADKIFTIEQIKKLMSKTDYERLKRMTDEEIEQAAKDDPDSALPTEEELKEFKKVKKNEDK